MSFRKANYFLAIRISDPLVIEKLKKVHFEFVKSHYNLKDGIVPLDEAHITLNVLTVEEEKLEEVKNLLRSAFEEKKSLIPPENIELKGLDSFGRKGIHQSRKDRKMIE